MARASRAGAASAYAAEYGPIFLLAAGVALWLLAPALPIPHNEAISWTALGVAAMGWWVFQVSGQGQATRWRGLRSAMFVITLLAVPSMAVATIIGMNPPAAPPTTYQEARGAYDCTDDCSGHEAGWAWAEENDIASPEECGGRSQSFIEGCEAYADEIGLVFY